jgi:hypothetical protein
MKPSQRRTLLALGLAACAVTAQAQVRAPGSAAPAPARPAASAAAPNAADGVISNPEFEKAGEMSAHAWLLLLDRKDWGSAWDVTSTVFRQAVPLPSWMDNIPKVRDPFGAFVERRPVEVVYKRSVAGLPPGDYVTAVFLTQFAGKKDVLEAVTTMRDRDGRWRVTGYQAQ